MKINLYSRLTSESLCLGKIKLWTHIEYQNENVFICFPTWSDFHFLDNDQPYVDATNIPSKTRLNKLKLVMPHLRRVNHFIV